MGVNGLWTVVQPCARPTNLATLNRKRLAVDASIWIYQFLKAVRDKEGNALRNSHVVGFFRRICKLLWFGILPIFVFDGGAPALKRATIQARARRREGRRDDAVKTASKLLAVQMQRYAEEEDERRKQREEQSVSLREEAQQEEVPDMSNVVYADEFGMSQQERQQARSFRKQDAYHLPELDNGISNMGKPDDPRIMSVEELELYAQQFHNGEDINLYDFSKIDFDGDFFKSLPPPDRYNIINAARLRSRLRLGLSKEQLDEMFPDRMAFSRFQIERVKERNHLTQRLMSEVGMNGTDLTLGINARVAGETGREYILVKNEGAEGGWALGVVSKDKDVGDAHKPIDVDAIAIQYQSKNDEVEDDNDDDFEDVPIEGLNRLPKPDRYTQVSARTARDMAIRRQHAQEPRSNGDHPEGGEDSLFVGGYDLEVERILHDTAEELPHPNEENDISRAIVMSLQSQHGGGKDSLLDVEGDEVQEDAPAWNQKAVEETRPITGSGGSMIAHIVNNRANAAVKSRPEKPAQKPTVTSDSESDDDMQAVMAKARLRRQDPPKPAVENKKNLFDGPLPFPKLAFGSSLFSKAGTKKQPETQRQQESTPTFKDDLVVENGDQDMAGGFEKPDENAPKPLPPWLADETTDIRASLQKQREVDKEINAEDRAEAEEEDRLRKRERRDQLIEIESSDDGSDVEIIDKPATPKRLAQEVITIDELREPSESEKPEVIDSPKPAANDVEPDAVVETSPEPIFEEMAVPEATGAEKESESRRSSASPEPDFEDVPAVAPTVDISFTNVSSLVGDLVRGKSPQDAHHAPADDLDDALFADVEYEEFSDPEDETLMAQLAEEAEEHARFASELNNKSAQQNKEEYEKELRQLRNQQKKDRRDADEVTQVMVTECQSLLRLFGIPYITAPMEAEAQCAELVNLGLVDGIVTDDSDTFLFGGTRVYKNMFNSNKFVELYLGSDLEKELSLSRDQLISLAQLLGSDYTEGLQGVGPVTAVEILSEFPGKGGLDQFREWWLSVQSQQRSKEADADSPFRRKFRKSQGKKLFLPSGFPNSAVYDAYLYPDVDNNAETFQWGVPDVEGLRQFLMATIGWGKEKTDEVLVPVIKDMNRRDTEGTQSNITRFFGGGVGAGAKEAFAPRQRAQGSKRMAAAVDRLRSNIAGEPPAANGSNSTGSRKRPARRQTIGDEEDEDAEEPNAESAAASTAKKDKGRANKKRTKAG